jgi:DNA polymerase I-like protein with 3'-5' exonuclease and polymerase domains
MAGFFSDEELADMSSGICPPAPTDYRLPTAFPSLECAKRIAFDWETFDPKISDLGNGVYRKDGHIVGGSIAAWDADDKLFFAEYFPVAHRGVENCDREKVYQYFRDNLNFYEGELIGANLLYDGDWCQSVGIMPTFAKWRDVQWAEALLDEMAFNYRLETISKKYLGTGKVTNQLKTLYGPDYIKRFHEVHPGHARAYGLGDVLLPKQILDCQYRELESLDMTDLFKMESRLTPFLLYMRRQGVRIDMRKAEELSGSFAKRRDEKLEAASVAAGVKLTVDNFTSPKLLVYIFDKLGIKYPKAKKGGASITDKWLDKLEHPFGKLLNSARKFHKAKSTFVDSYVFDYAVGDRIHCDFHPLRKANEDEEAGTESGRFSSGNPNLQNIPVRDEEIGPLMRGLFIPEEGAKWWAYDYSQIEYRFLIHYAVAMKCKDAEIPQKMYHDDPKTDFHDMVVELTKLKRNSAKNFNFRLVYGGGKVGAAQVLGMLDKEGKPTAEFNTIWDTYHGKAPFIKELLDKCSTEAMKTGEIRTILNRRSQFEFYEPAGKYVQKGKALPLAMAIDAYGFDLQRAETHKALNRKLQGSAADLFKLATVTAWEAGVFTSTTDFTCSLLVHDEEDGSLFPTKRGKECHAELRHILETALPLNVPVLVSGDVGANWAEAK